MFLIFLYIEVSQSASTFRLHAAFASCLLLRFILGQAEIFAFRSQIWRTLCVLLQLPLPLPLLLLLLLLLLMSVCVFVCVCASVCVVVGTRSACETCVCQKKES